MNMTVTICIAVLVAINVGVALLLLTKRARLVFGRPARGPEKGTIVVESKRRRGHKDGVKTHHLHLPPLTENEFYDVSDFFKAYHDKAGDKVVLHLANQLGAEEKIEVPYPVRWDSQVKDKLSVKLHGWV